MQRWGLCECVCECGRGVAGFWCVINQQHLPWHCLDSRLRAALLCCALFPLSAVHLSLPPSVCLSVWFCTFSFFSFYLYLPSFPLLSLLCLSVWLLRSVLCLYLSLSQKPVSLILSLCLTISVTPHFFFPSLMFSPYRLPCQWGLIIRATVTNWNGLPVIMSRHSRNVLNWKEMWDMKKWIVQSLWQKLSLNRCVGCCIVLCLFSCLL